MRNLTRMIIVGVFLTVALAIVVSREAMANQQDSQIQQSESVVEAAHRSRELKEHTANPARVITNDDLERDHRKPAQEDITGRVLTPTQTDSPNVSAVTATEASGQRAISGGNGSGLGNYESEEAAAEAAEIARLQAQLAAAEDDLNWQQRQLLLEQNTIYSNPAYTTTHVGKAQLDAAKLQIEQKQ